MKPPKLTGFIERQAKLERERAELFVRWKATLEEFDGAVAKAAQTLTEEFGERARFQAWNYTRSLGLVEYARELRRRAGLHIGPGRPRKRIE